MQDEQFNAVRYEIEWIVELQILRESKNECFVLSPFRRPVDKVDCTGNATDYQHENEKGIMSFHDSVLKIIIIPNTHVFVSPIYYNTIGVFFKESPYHGGFRYFKTERNHASSDILQGDSS